MTAPKVRKLNFEFDETVPFQWLPSNPAFGLYANAISFFAPPLEKFIVATTREALRQVTDTAVKQEAEAFMLQEAMHSKAHIKHVACLVKQYPGLQQTVAECEGLFEQLLKTESLAFRLAYTANLEATFTPLFTLCLNREEQLFRPGDDRVASLFLWHFVEEIEHRSSALILYDAIVGRPFYRLRKFGKVFEHVQRVHDCILRGFDVHVPSADRGAASRVAKQLVPPGAGARFGRDALTLTWRLLLSQIPNHDPARQPLPRFASTWLAGYDAGMNPLRYYGSHGARA